MNGGKGDGERGGMEVERERRIKGEREKGGIRGGGRKEERTDGREGARERR